MYRPCTILLSLVLIASGMTAPARAQPRLQDRSELAFPTREATWASVDVSPDGRRIVMDVLGGLYEIPITGGRARTISAGTAIDRTPTYSPDGSKLAFISDRSGAANLWISDSDGTNPRQISDLISVYADQGISSPTWSPDGATIVVSQSPAAVGISDGQSRTTAYIRGGRRLAVYDVASRRMHWLSQEPIWGYAQILAPAFDPDGRHVFATGLRESMRVLEQSTVLLKFDAGSGDASRPLGYFTGKSFHRPTPSPDGRFLAWVATTQDQQGLRLRDLHTGEERWLIYNRIDSPPDRLEQEIDAGAPRFDFTPDGQFIVIGFEGKLWRIRVSDGALQEIPFDIEVDRPAMPLGLHEHPISDEPTPVGAIGRAALSPDGRKIAFSALRRIWIVDVLNDARTLGNPRRLTNDEIAEDYPAWSADGSLIYFSVWRDGVGGGVRSAPVQDAPSAATTLVADGSVYMSITADPGSRRLAALRLDTGAERRVGDYLPANDEAGAGLWTLVSIDSESGHTEDVATLNADSIDFWQQVPAGPLYFTQDGVLHRGLDPLSWPSSTRVVPVAVARDGVEQTEHTSLGAYVYGVLSPDQRRALIYPRAAGGDFRLVELELSGQPRPGVPEPQSEAHASAEREHVAPFPVVTPWISWSADGSRVLVSQGSAIYLGEIKDNAPIAFNRLAVPLRTHSQRSRDALLLHGARLITMAADQVIESGDILIIGNRIAAIGPVGSVRIPDDAIILDVSGKTILPGFVDIHDHPHLPAGMLPDQDWRLLARLAFGVTATHDPSSSNTAIFEYRERQRAGELIGPRLFSTGPAYIGSTEIRTLDEARAIARLYSLDLGAETFKMYDLEASRTERRLLSEATREERLNATAHVAGRLWILALAMDGYPGMEHLPEMVVHDDMAQWVASSGATFTHTVGTMTLAYQYAFASLGNPRQNTRWSAFVPPSDRMLPDAAQPQRDLLLQRLSFPARIARSGGFNGVGGHGNIAGLSFHHELLFYAMGGMANADILRAATINGARALGHEGDFGSLEVGKLADLQILDMNPLEDITNTLSMTRVMVDGRLYQADTLNELWPQQRTLPDMYRQPPD